LTNGLARSTTLLKLEQACNVLQPGEKASFKPVSWPWLSYLRCTSSTQTRCSGPISSYATPRRLSRAVSHQAIRPSGHQAIRPSGHTGHTAVLCLFLRENLDSILGVWHVLMSHQHCSKKSSTWEEMRLETLNAWFFG
jgi:hypothetical protein